MTTATIALSDLVREDRMDAPFHLALARLSERVAALRTASTAAEAVALLDALPIEALRGLSVLARGSAPRAMSRTDAAALSREYPHLALAIAGEDADGSIAAIRERIADDGRAVDALLRIAGGAA